MGQTGSDFADILLSPEVLVTLILCAVVAGIIIWVVSQWQARQRSRALDEQRVRQEATIGRLLDSVAQDKQKVIAAYEEQLRQQDERVASLEQELGRLRDRLASSGILGLFGGKQRDTIGALLLENEQLHELLAQKQQQLHDLMGDMMDKLLSRLDEQAQESARAVRYKQALLSAFLQQEEARRLLDEMIKEGKLGQNQPPQLPT